MVKTNTSCVAWRGKEHNKRLVSTLRFKQKLSNASAALWYTVKELSSKNTYTFKKYSTSSLRVVLILICCVHRNETLAKWQFASSGLQSRHNLKYVKPDWFFKNILILKLYYKLWSSLSRADITIMWQHWCNDCTEQF